MYRPQKCNSFVLIIIDHTLACTVSVLDMAFGAGDSRVTSSGRRVMLWLKVSARLLQLINDTGLGYRSIENVQLRCSNGLSVVVTVMYGNYLESIVHFGH